MRDGLAALICVGGRTDDRTDGDFAAFEQAGTKYALGGEAQPVAGRAEECGHRADETDLAERVAAREAVDDRRPDARFGRAVDRFERAELALDAFADLGFGNEHV